MLSLLKHINQKSVAFAVRHMSKERAGKCVRPGIALVFDSAPHKVTKITQGKRGKGGGFVRAVLKNLLNGSTFEHTFTSDETVEIAELESTKATYSWTDGVNYNFMNTETFEEIQIHSSEVDQPDWLDEGQEVKLKIFKDKIIGVELPQTFVYKVAKIDASRTFDGNVRAVFSNGATLMVPEFVKEGDNLKINLIEEPKYMERVGAGL